VIHRLRAEWLLIAVAIACVLLGLAGRFHGLGQMEMTVWGDRDLWRALTGVHGWQVLGPETNSGARTPGGAFYILLAGFLAFDQSIIGAHFGLLALYAASAALLWLVFARDVSPLAGGLVAAVFTGSGMLLQSLSIWNPGYIVFFATVASLGAYRFIAGGHRGWLLTTAFILGVGLQIHMQLVQLGLGILLAMAVYRRRLGWRDGAALIAGLLAAYLPALMSANAAGMIAQAASMPGDGFQTYVIAERNWAGKLRLLREVLADSTRIFAAAAGMRFPWMVWLLRLADAVTILGAFAFLLRLRRGVTRRGGHENAPLGVFAILLVTYFAITAFLTVNFRHMAAVVPVVAVVSGLGIEALVRSFLARGGIVALAGAAGLAGLIALPAAVMGTLGFTHTAFFPTSATAQTEIAATLKNAFHADHDDFSGRAALVRYSREDGWRLVPGDIYNRMAFIFATTKAVGRVAVDDCVLVATKSDLEASPGLSVPAPDTVLGDEIATSEHFRYFSYRAKDGNCIKSFPNAYIATRFESEYLADLSPRKAYAVDGGAVFVVPQPNSRFPIGIELRRDGAELHASVHGRLLRGHTGLYTKTFERLDLCFVGLAGGVTVHLASALIGDIPGGTLAPWHSPSFTLADGEHAVWLIGKDQDGPVAAALGSVRVPTLDAALTVSGGEAVPAVCQ